MSGLMEIWLAWLIVNVISVMVFVIYLLILVLGGFDGKAQEPW